MSKIKASERKTDIRVLASTECNRMRKEGFDIPHLHLRNIELHEGMTRKELRKAIAHGTQFWYNGHTIPGDLALDIMENTVGKRGI